MPHILLENVTKRYGATVALDNVTLSVERGEVFSILGPSGCGKTTTLRVIAGLVTPDSGRVNIGDTDVTNVPPEKRNLGMVFQDYALWPHMNVFDNVAFGLKIRRLSREAIAAKVKEVLEIVELEGLENRYPSQLSGGQQQRVALARALALNPQAILFDEPLSNLDAKLREELRYELKTLLKKLGITAVYVTHDQVEAFTISDKIAIMRNGRLIQVDSPEKIYAEPVDSFVATFIGESSIIDVKISQCNENTVMVELNNGHEIPARKPSKLQLERGRDVYLVVRPDSIKIREDGSPSAVECNILKKTFLGDRVEYTLGFDNYRFKYREPPETNREIGSKVYVEFIPDKVVVVPK